MARNWLGIQIGGKLDFHMKAVSFSCRFLTQAGQIKNNHHSDGYQSYFATSMLEKPARLEV